MEEKIIERRKQGRAHRKEGKTKREKEITGLRNYTKENQEASKRLLDGENKKRSKK